MTSTTTTTTRYAVTQIDGTRTEFRTLIAATEYVLHTATPCTDLLVRASDGRWIPMAA